MILIKAGKSSFNFFVFILFLIAIASFFDVKKAEAVDTGVIINEVMFYPLNEDSGEFIELYNNGISDINLLNYYIKDNTSKDEFIQFTKKDFGQKNSFLLSPKSYAIILDPDYVDNYDTFINSFLCDDCLVLTIKNNLIGNGLNKDGDKVELYRIGTPDVIVDNISWIKVDASWQSYSYEKNSDGKWYKSIAGGTPGSENSILQIKEPVLFEGDILPIDGQQFEIFQEIIFSWKEENGVSYEYQIAKDDIFLTLINESELTIGKYFWRVKAKNQIFEIYSIPRSFEIIEPVYSKNIIISEICPHPSGGTDNEFIELYNSGNQTVDLGGWYLDDINGGSTPYEIQAGTKIGSKKYLAFYRSATGIALNDTNGDSARLIYPNDKVAYSVIYSENAPLGYSWARKTDGVWAWTTSPTFGSENKITLPVKEVKSEKDDTISPINTVPIEIPTGNYEDYLDKLVKVKGKVTSTSGNTFYLDDGSGEVKIYIQEKTGIDKPEMHKNDIFEVTGIVDLYGKTWRILPQKVEDIKLIEQAFVVSSTAKTTKKATIEKVENLITPEIKEVKAAENNNLGTNTVKDTKKTSFWIQLAKAGVGLAIILFIIFIIKILRRPKPITIGGHFGDDET